MRNSTRLLASLGPLAVGVLFVGAAAAKLVAPGRAHQHLRQLGLPAARWTAPLPAVLGTGEAMLGAALVAGLAPGTVAPATAGLLAALAGVTVWSTSTDRTDDCGCYGGLVEVRPWVSVVLNAVYAVLVVLGWQVGRPLIRTRSYQIAGVAAIGGLAAAVAMLGERRLRTTGKPLVDLNPMRAGRRWKRSWLPSQAEALATGEQLVVFMGASCPLCKLWVSPLNKINARSDLPPVLGVMGVAEDAVAAYVEEHQITFPVVSMKKATLGRLVDAVPTIAVLRDGRVHALGQGVLPPDLLERVKQRPQAASATPSLAIFEQLQRVMRGPGEVPAGISS